MDKFPLLLEGRAAGELTARWEASCTWFDVRCRLPEGNLWCAWAVGERGELRLGVLEPDHGTAVLHRRFSDRMTLPLGRLLRGEIRPACGEPETWRPAPKPEEFFRSAWLRRRLRGLSGARTRRDRERFYLALPYDPRRAFPLVTLFCFARVRVLEGRPYAVFAFEGEEPVFH